MENSRQNTRFHWRSAKRLEALSKVMDTEGNKVELGGDLEVDGELQVNTGAIVNAENETISVTQDMKDAISGNNEVVISITDDDYEAADGYVKHVELNNTYISFNFTGTHQFQLTLYCPFLKGIAYGYDMQAIETFSGLVYNAEDRLMVLTDPDLHLAVFNGIVYQIETDA